MPQRDSDESKTLDQSPVLDTTASNITAEDPLGADGHSSKEMNNRDYVVDGEDRAQQLDTEREANVPSAAMKAELVDHESIQEEPFNMALMHESLGSNDSDCAITLEYKLEERGQQLETERDVEANVSSAAIKAESGDHKPIHEEQFNAASMHESLGSNESDCAINLEYKLEFA